MQPPNFRPNWVDSDSFVVLHRIFFRFDSYTNAWDGLYLKMCILIIPRRIINIHFLSNIPKSPLINSTPSVNIIHLLSLNRPSIYTVYQHSLELPCCRLITTTTPRSINIRFLSLNHPLLCTPSISIRLLACYRSIIPHFVHRISTFACPYNSTPSINIGLLSLNHPLLSSVHNL